MKKILMILLVASSMLLVHAQEPVHTDTLNDFNLLDLVQDQHVQSAQPMQQTPAIKQSKSAQAWDGRRHSLELTIGDPMVLMMLNHKGCGDERFILDESLDCSYRDQYYEYVRHHRYESELWLPTFSLRYNYAFTHWFELGVIVGATAYGTYYSASTDFSDSPLVGDRLIYIMPSIRFTYLRRDLINLYAAAAGGIGITIANSDVFLITTPENKHVGFEPAFQLSAFGMQVGRRVYWNLEIGFGTMGIFNTGIGVKL